MRTSALRSPPRCRSTSATREVPGSAAATKTPTAWSASTSREEPTSRASPKRISMRLPCDSINVRERPWASKLRPINYKRCCTDRLNSQSVNQPIRQKMQSIVKQACGRAGIDCELKTVVGSVYFSSDPGNPDTESHFYADLELSGKILQIGRAHV